MKNKLRKQVLDSRDALSPEERGDKSRKIGELLCSLPEYRSARMVLFFASFRSEVETGPMIRRALGDGKRVVLPRVAGSELSLYEIEDFSKDVSPGAWGIPEPKEMRPVRIEDVDLIIVPGAAFDENGNRIGYGAGFYDKLLAGFRGRTVALAFEIQIVGGVPASAHDIPVRKIVTEKRVIETK